MYYCDITMVSSVCAKTRIQDDFRPSPPFRRTEMAPVPEKSSYSLIPMQTALETIASTLQSLPVTQVPTTSSLNQILAEDIYAPYAHPPFRASIKDGYAITLPLPEPPVLKIVTPTFAGNPTPPPLLPGTAAYVTTGAPVPPSTDAVIMIENCLVDTPNLTFTPSTTAKSGQDIRPIGSDLAPGQLVLPKGIYVGPAELGILTACAIHTVHVYPRPIIGVLSSGDELLDISTISGPLPPDKIIDSNRPMLLAAIQQSLPACKPIDLGIVSDNMEHVQEALTQASESCHIVITSGGVSMGRRDYIKPALENLATIHFGRVCMKPGKPLTYATRSPNRALLALPGNPVSCFVCFHLAVCVAARRLSGFSQKESLGRMVEATLADDIRLDPDRPEYHRATLTVRNISFSFSCCLLTCRSGGMALDGWPHQLVNRLALAFYRLVQQMHCFNFQLNRVVLRLAHLYRLTC